MDTVSGISPSAASDGTLMSGLILQQFQSHGLKPIDMQLPSGECISLAGPSGCGKTLLLRAIADLDQHSGEVILDNSAQSDTAAPDWRRWVGLLPAESHWWEETVGRHFPNPADPLLAALGLPPESMEWDTHRISSGERQRLALARLLSGGPKALLLDEPTANLDQQNIQRVESLIADYRADTGASVLWVSHDPEQRKRVANRGYIICNGAIKEESWS